MLLQMGSASEKNFNSGDTREFMNFIAEIASILMQIKNLDFKFLKTKLQFIKHCLLFLNVNG